MCNSLYFQEKRMKKRRSFEQLCVFVCCVCMCLDCRWVQCGGSQEEPGDDGTTSQRISQQLCWGGSSLTCRSPSSLYGGPAEGQWSFFTLERIPSKASVEGGDSVSRGEVQSGLERLGQVSLLTPRGCSDVRYSNISRHGTYTSQSSQHQVQLDESTFTGPSPSPLTHFFYHFLATNNKQPPFSFLFSHTFRALLYSSGGTELFYSTSYSSSLFNQ